MIVILRLLFLLKSPYLHPIRNPSDIRLLRHREGSQYLLTIITNLECLEHMYHPWEVHTQERLNSRFIIPFQVRYLYQYSQIPGNPIFPILWPFNRVLIEHRFAPCHMLASFSFIPSICSEIWHFSSPSTLMIEPCLI